MVLCSSLALLCCGIQPTQARGPVSPASTSAAFDVIHYNAEIEPEIASKTLKGKEVIRFVSGQNGLVAVDFDCGELTIDAVSENRAPQKLGDRIVSYELRESARRGKR